MTGENELKSASNSWDIVWNHVKDIPEFIEIRDEILKDGNQGCATMICEFIDSLLRRIED